MNRILNNVDIMTDIDGDLTAISTMISMIVRVALELDVEKVKPELFISVLDCELSHNYLDISRIKNIVHRGIFNLVKK